MLLEFNLELPDDYSENFRTNLSQESKLYTFPTLQNLDVAEPASNVCEVLQSIYSVCLSRIKFSPVDAKAGIPKCIQRCTTMTLETGPPSSQYK